MSERIDYFDVLRGLAIIGVVTIHVSGSATQVMHAASDHYLNIFWRNFWNFSVPLFIAISGYFLAKKTFSKNGDYLNFLSKQVPKVYWPFLFWSFICFLLAVATKAPVSSELIKLLTFQSSGPYYFIALIIQYYLLLPILKHLANLKGLIASVAVSLAATYLIFHLRYISGIDLALIIYAGNFVTWLMFFILGLYMGSANRMRVSNTVLLSITAGFYLLSCLETGLLIEWFNQPQAAVTAIKPSSFIYSFALIAYLFKNINIVHSQLIKKLGGISFGIYLIHMLALGIESRISHKLLPAWVEGSFLYQIMLTGLVILTCAFAISLLNKLLSDRQSKLIGFK
ncbi:acyltransferase [Methylophilus luteus]|uniref:Acyltransferase n=1 Tax=Methylophilus luteus TaxID=640108 RepID=A0ABW3F425_9PROT